MKTNQSDFYYYGSEAHTLLKFLTSQKFMTHVKYVVYSHPMHMPHMTK